MRRVSVIGIGPGDPRQVTLEAIEVMRTVDVFFVVIKTPAGRELVDLRHEILRRHVGDRGYRVVQLADPERERAPKNYRATVAAWRDERARRWSRALRDGLDPAAHGAFLVWGDPSLYDSTLDVLGDVRADLPMTLRVVPGISSVQLLAARHGISLNRVGGAIALTPARRLAGGLPPGVDDVVVLLDAGAALDTIDEPGLHVYWGAYLGTEDELLADGPLERVRHEIARLRADAKQRKGWMFDTYLLRRAR